MVFLVTAVLVHTLSFQHCDGLTSTQSLAVYIDASLLRSQTLTLAASKCERLSTQDYVDLHLFIHIEWFLSGCQCNTSCTVAFLCVFAEDVHFIPVQHQLLSFVGNSQLCIAVTTIDSGTIGPVQFSVRIDNFVNPFLPPPNPLNVFEPNTVTVVIEEGEHRNQSSLQQEKYIYM